MKSQTSVSFFKGIISPSYQIFLIISSYDVGWVYCLIGENLPVQLIIKFTLMHLGNFISEIIVHSFIILLMDVFSQKFMEDKSFAVFNCQSAYFLVIFLDESFIFFTFS